MSSTTDGSGGSARPDANARLMEQQSEFQRAERILEIGGGDFSRVILLAERYPEKRFVSIDYRFGTASKENAGRASALPNLSILKFGLLDRILAHEAFDFAFSIAVMEHVPQLEAFLSEVFLLLRPRGVYAYFQAPFWTCKTGHHFRHDDPLVTRVLNSYEHLILGAAGMRGHLKKFGKLPFDAEKCIDKIYARSDLSRLSPKESLRIVQGSKFVLVEWSERVDADFDQAKAEVAVAANGQRYSLDDLRTSAVFARLLKP